MRNRANPDQYIKRLLREDDPYADPSKNHRYLFSLYCFNNNAAAIRNRDVEKIKSLCKEDTLIGNVNEDTGESLLDVAVSEGKEDPALLEIVEHLLSKKCHVDFFIQDQFSPLARAASQGHKQLTTLLINQYTISTPRAGIRIKTGHKPLTIVNLLI